MNYKVIIGDVTCPVIHSDHCYILQIVNDENRQSAGVAKAIYKKWPQVKTEYHEWFYRYGERLYRRSKSFLPAKLGRNQYIEVEENLTVVNMIAQSDCGGYQGYPPIRYQSLCECLIRFADHLNHQRQRSFEIAAPLFGTGLAGGTIKNVITVVNKAIYNRDIFADVLWTWYVLTDEEKKETEAAFHPRCGIS
jgi:O-acetyl-ADP-ribose deacetylase (regulator of RNase III)